MSEEHEVPEDQVESPRRDGILYKRYSENQVPGEKRNTGESPRSDDILYKLYSKDQFPGEKRNTGEPPRSDDILYKRYSEDQGPGNKRNTGESPRNDGILYKRNSDYQVPGEKRNIGKSPRSHDILYNPFSEDQVPGNKRNTGKFLKSADMLCKPCSKKDRHTMASVYCSTCNEFQCSECSQIHEVYEFMKTHQLVVITSARPKRIPFDMTGMNQCDQHKEVLKFFCKDESELCCSTCAVMNHRRCNRVVEIQTMAGSSSVSTSTKLKSRLEKAREKAELVAKYTLSYEEQILQDVTEIATRNKRMRDDVDKMFNDLSVCVANDAREYRTETLAELAKKQSDSEKHIKDATKSLETIDNVYQNGTPSQQFIVEQRMEKQANKLWEDVEETCKYLEIVTVSFDFDDTLKLPPLPISDYVPGQLTLRCFLPNTAKPIAPKDPIVKLTKITSIDVKKTRDDVGEPLYSGLDFLSDGRLVVVDINNKKCLIYNKKLKKEGSFQFSDYPGSVVAVSEEEVAITSGDKYKIEFLGVSKSNKITSIRTEKVTKTYFSINLMDERHFVVGTVNETVPVAVVSLSGEENYFDFDFPSKKYAIGTAACTYMRNKKKIVLTDRYEDKVYIYPADKQTKRRVVKDDQIKEPFGVAVGPSDCILVSSYETHSIVQISPSGRVIGSCKLEIKPLIVCVSKDKSILAVTNDAEGELQLQLYKITY